MNERVPDPRGTRYRPARNRGPQLLLVAAIVAAIIGFGVHSQGASSEPPSASSVPVPLVVGAVPYWDEEEARLTLETHSRQIAVASPWSYSVAAEWVGGLAA